MRSSPFFPPHRLEQGHGARRRKVQGRDLHRYGTRQQGGTDTTDLLTPPLIFATLSREFTAFGLSSLGSLLNRA